MFVMLLILQFACYLCIIELFLSKSLVRVVHENPFMQIKLHATCHSPVKIHSIDF
jgi:hypothetical protein